MRKQAKINIILISLSAVASLVISIYLASFVISNFRSFTINILVLKLNGTYVTALIIFILIVISILLSDRKSAANRLGKSKTLNLGLENSHFMTEKEIKKNYRLVSFKNLEKENSGIVVMATDTRCDMKVALADNIHTLVIGNTGSGKTATFISPSIQIMSKCKDKPSMIIADPKGELLDAHSKLLKERGYKIQVIDLINPLRSTRWNPLSPVYDRYQEMLITEDGFKKQEINDDIFDQLNELVKCVFKANEKAHDKMWEQGMQNFILAVLLAMLEDSEYKERKMTKGRYNFANVRAICSRTDNECEELRAYFAMRSVSSNARILASGVLNTAERTLQSYFTTIAQAMTTFADQSICAFMSESKVSFETYDEEPTALFLKIPDERQSRYNIASAFFANTYRELVSKARKNEKSSLKKPVYFIIDEFANLPSIPGIDKMLAVARSRNIFFTIVLQSYEQLENAYGKSSAEVIKGNCNIEMFIGSKEIGTLEAFSKKCGNYTITSTSVSVSSGKDSGSGTTSAKERPLVYATELSKLNNPPKEMGNTIVLASGKVPLKSKFTPIFKGKCFSLGGIKEDICIHKLFDVKENYYDIRNVIENSYEEIPDEVIPQEREYNQKSHDKDVFISKTLIKYLAELDVINEGGLIELFKKQQFNDIVDLIVEGVDKAKAQKNNHILSILTKEMNVYKSLYIM